MELARVGGVGEINVKTLQLTVTDPLREITDLEGRSPLVEEETGLLVALKWPSKEGVEMDGEPIPLKSIPHVKTPFQTRLWIRCRTYSAKRGLSVKALKNNLWLC